MGTSRGVLRCFDHFPNTATLNRVWRKHSQATRVGIGHTLPKTFQYQRKRFRSPPSVDIFISKSFQRIRLQRPLRFLTSLLLVLSAGPLRSTSMSPSGSTKRSMHASMVSSFRQLGCRRLLPRQKIVTTSPSEAVGCNPLRLQAKRFVVVPRALPRRSLARRLCLVQASRGSFRSPRGCCAHHRVELRLREPVR